MRKVSTRALVSEVMEATAITKADAEKKYPPPHGGSYPPANRDPHEASGLVTSPYPPYQKYECAKIAHGGLVLDVRAKKVFVRSISRATSIKGR